MNGVIRASSACRWAMPELWGVAVDRWDQGLDGDSGGLGADRALGVIW